MTEPAANTRAVTKTEAARLHRTIDRLETENRRLKADRERLLTDYRFSHSSRRLVSDLIRLLAQLEHEADPTRGIDYTGPGTNHQKPTTTPDPGSHVAKERGRLRSVQERIRRIIRQVHREMEDEAMGRERPKIERPKCRTCGRRGQVGDRVCPRGCGPYPTREDENE